MQTFKVGDRVKCIKPDYGLELNLTYTIMGVDGEYVSVARGEKARLYSYRFVKLTAQFKGNIK